MVLEAGDFLRTAEDARALAVGAATGKPVFLRDVADGRATAARNRSQYVATGTRDGFRPAVTIAVSKRKGTNAITVADAVLERVEKLKGRVVPGDVDIAITRQYGETAAEKSNELLWHMLIAIVSVSVLIAITLGLRESWIVFTAIPVTLALTLTTIYLYGFTLNRITLFALIFSIGILVDDAIVVVENIARHWRLPQNQGRDRLRDRRGGGGRGRQSDHSGHAGGDRGDPADGVRRRPDGSLHAADPDRRVLGDGVLAAGGVHRDAVGGGASAEGARRARCTKAARKTSSRGSTAASCIRCCTSR